MKKLLVLSILLTNSLVAKETTAKLPTILCKFDKRSIKIDLSEKYNINTDFAYKAEFYFDKINFGYCMLKIEDEYSADTSQSAFNQVIFSNSSCKFISEKHSKDLSIAPKGIINYNVKNIAFIDMFLNQQPMKCKVK